MSILKKNNFSSIESIKDDLKQVYKSEAKAQPYTIAYQHIQKLISKGSYLPEDYLKAIDIITDKSFLLFSNNIIYFEQ